MSDQELYEIASQRIRRRNRRWILWSLNLGVLLLLLAGMILAGGGRTALTFFLAWGAVFTTHTIILGFIESTDGSIENEVARMRRAVQSKHVASDSAVYEKPKRLELGEDGELSEVEDWEREDAQRHRNPTRS
jgi:hypothetical protein